MIADFLEGREYRFSVNTVTTERETSNIGVPQGAILASHLINLYSSDSDKSDCKQHA